MSTTETRVRVVWDNDYQPDGDYDLAEEAEKLASGEWGAYGVIAESKCPCCGTWGEKVVDLWGVVVEGSYWAGTYATPDEIKESYLREVARENVAEVTGS